MFSRFLNNWKIWLPIFGLYTALRLPSFFTPQYNLDEGYYLSIGWDLINGNDLYMQTWDRKPPVIYWLYAFFVSIFGNNTLWIPFVSFIFGLVTLLALTLIAQFFGVTGKIRIFVIALAAIILGSPYLEAHLLNAENIFIPLLLWGLYGFVTVYEQFRGSLTDIQLKTASYILFIISGVLIALGFMTKIHAILESIGILIGLSVFYIKSKKFHWQPYILALIGFTITLSIIATPFLLKGEIEWVLRSIFTSNSSYVELNNKPAQIFGIELVSGLEADRTVYLSSLGFRVIILLLTFCWYAWFVRNFKYSGKSLILFPWFACTLFAVLLSGRNYGHYFLQLIPVLLIILGVWLHVTEDFLQSRKYRPQQQWYLRLSSIFAWICLVQMLIFYGSVYKNQLSMDVLRVNRLYGDLPIALMTDNYNQWRTQVLTEKFVTYPLDETISAIQNYTSPQEKIWVYSNIPDIPFRAQRPSGYVAKTWFDVNDFTRQRVMQELQANPPQLIVWDADIQDPANQEVYNRIQMSYTRRESYQAAGPEKTSNFEIWLKN